MPFINHAKKARQRARLTINAAAKEVGVQPQYIWMIETGKRSPSLSVIERMCRAYNCDPSRIFDYDPEDNNEMQYR